MEMAYFISIQLSLCYLIPLLIIVICYVLVCHRIWRRQIPGSSHSHRSNCCDGGMAHRRTRKLQQSKLRALRMVAVVVAAFAFSWLPLYFIFSRIKLANAISGWAISSELEANILSALIPLCQWLSSANSCVNPFLYHFLDPRFRFRFRQLLLGRRRLRRTTICFIDRRRRDERTQGRTRTSLNIIPLRAVSISKSVVRPTLIACNQRNNIQLANRFNVDEHCL